MGGRPVIPPDEEMIVPPTAEEARELTDAEALARARRYVRHNLEAEVDGANPSRGRTSSDDAT